MKEVAVVPGEYQARCGRTDLHGVHEAPGHVFCLGNKSAVIIVETPVEQEEEG